MSMKKLPSKGGPGWYQLLRYMSTRDTCRAATTVILAAAS
jgi:hypothetical protein